MFIWCSPDPVRPTAVQPPSSGPLWPYTGRLYTVSSCILISQCLLGLLKLHQVSRPLPPTSCLHLLSYTLQSPGCISICRFFLSERLPACRHNPQRENQGILLRLASTAPPLRQECTRPKRWLLSSLKLSVAFSLELHQVWVWVVMGWTCRMVRDCSGRTKV
jgi:hypothetical protein